MSAARSPRTYALSGALVLAAGAIASFAYYDYHHAGNVAYMDLEIYAGPIAAYGAAVILDRNQRRRLALVASAAGAYGGVCLLAYPELLGFIYDPSYLRPDFLFWSLWVLLLAGVATAWSESRSTVPDRVQPAAMGGALGGAFTYFAILAFALVAIARCGT